MEYDLLYENLTSCLACQAVLDLWHTNPKLYANITFACSQGLASYNAYKEIPNTLDVDLTVSINFEEAVVVEGDGDDDYTVDKVHAMVMNAWTAAKAIDPLPVTKDDGIVD
ncbi:unnamed protein product [Rhizoctonia solani]|uniref:Uncharacterized protein n=1 Tax=Rhizoctonia solani TaxID=456999 RepID=A0A8H2WGI6_9AGAM|nr:unnamed protein product [Rhizoctonia solani]